LSVKSHVSKKLKEEARCGVKKKSYLSAADEFHTGFDRSMRRSFDPEIGVYVNPGMSFSSRSGRCWQWTASVGT